MFANEARKISDQVNLDADIEVFAKLKDNIITDIVAQTKLGKYETVCNFSTFKSADSFIVVELMKHFSYLGYTVKYDLQDPDNYGYPCFLKISW